MEGEGRRPAAAVFYLQPGDIVEERHIRWLILCSHLLGLPRAPLLCAQLNVT